MDLRLDEGEHVPRYTQLVRALVREIRRGRLPPGAPLPGTRTFARELGVNRKVVVAAIEELVAQGWLIVEKARGTRVSTTLPDQAVADVEAPPRGRPRADRASRPILSLGDGVPDARLAPLTALGRAYRRALSSLARSGLGYSDPAGDEVLRDVLASFLNQARGFACRRENVLITRGSQMAGLLAGLALSSRGDRIVVETPGYRPAWDAFRFAGAELIYVPVDNLGLDTKKLASALAAAKGRVRAVYVTPHHQYPTTVGLSAARRIELLALAKEYGFTIIEDDYDYEYHFDARPLLPLASTAGLDSIVYIGSLSKLLAPAIRVGYLVAREEIVEIASQKRALVDRQGDVALERAVAELIEDGELQRHARKARRIYRSRRESMLDIVARDRRLSRILETTVPPGGLALWFRVAPSIDVAAWSERALARGLAFSPGRTHSHRVKIQAFRAGFASLDEDEMRLAVERLSASIPP